ncbi:MAG: HAD family hydrolase [Pseudomonadota bacterium]
MSDITAILFDKDGTLFDFRQTWGQWTAMFLRDLATTEHQVQALAEAIRFDLTNEVHLPDSPLIAGTLDDWIGVMAPVVPEIPRDELRRITRDRSTAAVQVPATPLLPLLGLLRARGYPLGVATNDGIAPVTQQLRNAGIDHLFDYVAGYDSGFGAKPGPGMLLGFADHVDVEASKVVMIGDSTHDMEAAAAAGMRRVAVLTGYATAEDLAPHAEVVLPSIAELPRWLDRMANPTG